MTTLLKREYAREKPGLTGSFSQIVHPDDIELVAGLGPLSFLVIYECLSVDKTFILVRRTSTEPPFRILSDALQSVPTPVFNLGESVLTAENDQPQLVTIHRLEWHVSQNQEVYYVIRNGRLSKKRYFANELRHVQL